MQANTKRVAGGARGAVSGLRGATSGALAVLFALAPPGGAAQSIDLASLQELDDDRTDISHEELTVDDLEGLDIVRDGEIIGDIEEVLGDENEEIVAVVVEYGGGVLGLGDREVVMPIDELEFPRGRAEAEITLSDEELAELPVWDD